jgi:hypothetical protein
MLAFRHSSGILPSSRENWNILERYIYGAMESAVYLRMKAGISSDPVALNEWSPFSSLISPLSCTMMFLIGG